MNRRGVLVGGVAVTAAAVGAGVAWRRHAAAPGDDAERELWRARFERPAGGKPLAFEALRGRQLLLNFWATWCPPCVAELPMLDQFQRDQAKNGWQVVGLAVDNLEPVVSFLARRPVSFDIGLAGVDGIVLAKRLGNTGGGLPFSIVFDRSGRAAQRKLGAIAVDDLQHWAATVG
jgi:thiol-disulfide isomerase/thioredoxin